VAAWQLVASTPKPADDGILPMEGEGCRVASCSLSNWVLLSLPHSVTGGLEKDIASVVSRL
jgi:hypothetical protein